MQTWLQDAMDAFGVSQRQQLAEKLGVHPSTITYIERTGLTRRVFKALREAAAADGIELPDSVHQAWVDQTPANGKAVA